MLVPFDIKIIGREHMQSKNGEVCRANIENTMIVYFDIKLIRREKNSIEMTRLAEQLLRIT